MRRICLLPTLAFLAGLSIGFFTRGAAMGASQQKDTRAAELAAIGQLHSADVQATLTQDPSALTNLWSDDGVNLGFPGAPVVGTKAMREAYEKFRAANPNFQVLNYTPEIKDVQILDEWAIEVGDFTRTYKMSAKGNPITIQARNMRLLKRQSDGSWKFALVGLK